MAQIDFARLQGQEWLEASEEILKHFDPTSVTKPLSYCIVKGIKICRVGDSETIQANLNRTHYFDTGFKTDVK